MCSNRMLGLFEEGFQAQQLVKCPCSVLCGGLCDFASGLNYGRLAPFEYVLGSIQLMPFGIGKLASLIMSR
jgi:hypothetical protein